MADYLFFEFLGKKSVGDVSVNNTKRIKFYGLIMGVDVTAARARLKLLQMRKKARGSFFFRRCGCQI